MADFNLKEFIEFEAIAIGAGEYGEAADSAKVVGQYEKMKYDEKKAYKKKINKL